MAGTLPRRCFCALGTALGIRRIALVAFPVLLLATPLHAQSSNFSGTAALSSQLVDRGLAVSPVTPMLQGNLVWSSASGWAASLSAATELRSPGHSSETLAQIARGWSLSGDWRMQAGLVYYTYPGNAPARAYDRVETGLNWMYRDVLSLGISAIDQIHGSDHGPRGAADLNFHWPLPWRLALSVGLGVTQPLIGPSQKPAGYGSNDGWGSSGGGYRYAYPHEPTSSYYGYGHLGLAWTYDPWRVELDRVVADPDIRRQSGSAPAPWVATISWSF